MPPAATDSFDEDPDESGVYAENVFDDEPGVLPCPYCGEDVSELAELCPRCKNYLSQEDAPVPRKPRWRIATAIVLILIFSIGGVMIFFH